MSPFESERSAVRPSRMEGSGTVSRRNAWIVRIAPLAALGWAIAAAPAQDAKSRSRRADAAVSRVDAPALSAAETNEQIVADFLRRKERAEKAQRAFVAEFRRAVDVQRAAFEEARRKFDDARGRYVEIAGPLPNTAVFSPTDPRLPYEFEFRRPSTPAPSSAPIRTGSLAPKQGDAPSR